MSIFKRIVGGLFIASLLVLLGGCTNKKTYVSTPELPTTLLISETSTDRVLWAMDVPVQHKVKIQLIREGQDDIIDSHGGGLPPKQLKWWLYDFAGLEVASDSMSLPGTNVLLNVQYRPAPEQPGVVPIPTRRTASASASTAAKPTAATAKPATAPAPATKPAAKPAVPAAAPAKP